MAVHGISRLAHERMRERFKDISGDQELMLMFNGLEGIFTAYEASIRQLQQVIVSYQEQLKEMQQLERRLRKAHMKEVRDLESWLK